eukprot:TRINITY_DN2949_c0_g1_i2.p1 TRINITY_DN2949_c0_g1~~TRINITY_DN2949_c0_g1_i2.p1  ORF type:complete len:564 (+),score=206.30 TRINITY_DN2949_c0_g1_i2:98-1789(+)
MGNSASKKKEEAELRAKDVADRKARQEAIRLKAEAEEQAIRNEKYTKLILHVFQSSARGYLARKEFNTLKAMVVKRKKIAEEILTTEKTYVENLGILIEVFNIPLLGTVLVNEHNQTRSFAHHKKDNKKSTMEDLTTHYSKSAQNSPISHKSPESSHSVPDFNSAALNRRSMAVTSSETRALSSSTSDAHKSPVRSPSQDSSKSEEKSGALREKKKKSAESGTSSSTGRARRGTEHSRKKTVETASAFKKLRPVSSVLKFEDISEADAPKIPGLTREDVKRIFSQIEVIANYNQSIGIEVEKRVNAWEWQQRLGDIFLGLLDFLKTYVAYVNNYNESLETIDKLKTTLPAFAEWLAIAERNPQCSSLNLSGFLIMPIQRIPRYVMLLEDLLKNTPENPMHRDRAELSEALMKMKDVAKMINDKKREAENFQVLVTLYNQLDPQIPDLCEAHRRLLKHGVLKEEGAEVTLYLMNDFILITKERSATKQKPVHRLKIGPTMRIANVELDKNNKMFQIEMTGIDGIDAPIVLKAPKPEEKESWVRDINEQISEFTRRASSFATKPK